MQIEGKIYKQWEKISCVDVMYIVLDIDDVTDLSSPPKSESLGSTYLTGAVFNSWTIKKI